MAVRDKQFLISIDRGPLGTHGTIAMVSATKRELVSVAREFAVLCITTQGDFGSVRIKRIGTNEWADNDASRAFRWLVIYTTSANTRELSQGASELIEILLGTKRA